MLVGILLLFGNASHLCTVWKYLFYALLFHLCAHTCADNEILHYIYEDERIV